ncbi:S-adenosyl-L-methionine-dependent methyltransferase superfamily protein [Abeliophyllum distichum]|uniref:S-adenosyl-L-methionine-dependent methyltransferase superfamily protein n=1 Tax=Abeliophyllum distichum TaxID=126358 RepID=A0ABD1SFM7_9LAMI
MRREGRGETATGEGRNPLPSLRETRGDKIPSLVSRIPIEHVKTLVKFKSRYNYIRVLKVSRRADHTLAGSRLLLLDAPGNIHSISYLFKSITNTYFDVFATLPTLLPPGPLGILGFGAGSAAKLILETYSQIIIHGWELDQSVISVAREYFGLAKMEAQYPDRLFIHIGNALNASIRDGFSGILIDLFSKGVVIPELQNPQTWYNLRKNLKRDGRIMVNVGGNCVEPEDIRKDGSVIMEETFCPPWFRAEKGGDGLKKDITLKLRGRVN